MKKQKSILNSKKFETNKLTQNVVGGMPHGWTPAKNQWVTRTNVHHGSAHHSPADVAYAYDVFGDIALDS